MSFIYNNFLLKYLLLIAVFIFFMPLNSWSQKTYVPDDNFENYLEANGMGDGIALNDSVFTNNINTVTNLTVSSLSISDLTGIEDFAALSVLDAQGNQITSLDLSYNAQLNTIRCENNQLYRLNVKNGNNTNVTQFFTTGNPSLECINVDDSTYSANNWTNIDSQQYFGESCFCSLVIDSQVNVSCFGGFDGSLQVSGYGGSGVYSYTFGTYNSFFDTIFQLGQSPGFYVLPWNLVYLSADCYTFTIIDSTGTCGDTTLICITEPDEITSSTNQTVCDDFLFNGNLYNTSGSYDAVLTANNGCDSTVTLNLTVNNSDSIISNITACDSYIWFGNTYTSSGTFDTTFNNLNGCDSVFILNLTINNSVTNNISANSCNSYDWDGLTYTTSGQYVNIYSGTNGCDSTVTLNLTLTYSDTSFINISACDSFTLNNISYNQSGLYFQTISADSLTGFNYLGTYNGSTYYISESPEYWAAAQSNCIAKGGNLVCISDANENNFVSNILPGQQFWLGYTDETVEGSFVWVDGSNHTYTKWSPTEPSNSGPTGNEDYTLINSGEGGSNPLDGFWNDVDDNLSQYLYVLELPYTHLTSNGCDSIIALNLTINVSDTSYTNITACDSVEWNGELYDSSGTYYSNTVSNNNYSMIFDGFDDFIDCGQATNGNILSNNATWMAWVKCNNLSTPQVISSKWVSGPNTQWAFGRYHQNNQSGEFYLTLRGANGSYNSHFSNGFNLQANEWSHISVVWDQDSLYFYKNGALLNTEYTGQYSLNQTSGNLLIGAQNNSPQEYFWDGSLDDIQIWNQVLTQQEIQNYMTCPPNISEIGLVRYWNFEEGSGNTAYDLTSNGNDGTISGASYDTNVPVQSCQLTNSNGCDSVAVLNLTINNSSYTTDSITICEGSNVTVGTNTYDTSGVYIDTLQSINGCDSIINTVLDVINLNINQNDTSICLGDSIVLSVNSSFSNFSDTNTQSLRFNYGQYATIPNNGSLLNDTTYTIEFWYKEAGFSGGDEHIFGNDWFSSKIYFSRGGGDVNFLRGNNLSTNNIQNQWNHYAGVRDGDSVYFFIDGALVDSETYNNSISTSVTDFTVNHHTWNSGSSARLSGFFDELRISNNARYISSFTPPNYEFITDSNTLYLLHFNGDILDEMNNNGTLNGASFSSDVPFSSYTQITANNNTYLWSTGDTTSSITVVPTQTTTYFVTQIQNGISCSDSITVTVLDTFMTSFSINSCDSYIWDGVTYTSSGQYTNIYSAVNGCDSTVTLNLTINNSSSSTLTIVACDSYFWEGNTYNLTGVYTNMYVDINGCDSSVTLDLTINNSSSSSVIVTACDLYIWDGVYYDSSGQYINTYTALNGCDSIVNLDLTIHYSSYNSFPVISCNNYIWDGVTYDSSALYTNLYTDINGCDSSVTLDLTINNSSSSLFSVISCDSYSWDGITYTSTGTYTNVYLDSNGCDSSVTLDLTINNSYTNILTLSVCDSFLWDSVIYTTSGIYTNIYTGSNGCDSSVTFDLVVNYSESSTEIVSICDSSYTWGGITYSSEGTYSNVLVFTNSNGCDSVVTLNLTIGLSDTSNFSVEICDSSYTWDGITYDSSGIYTNTYTNTFGCDSIVSLYLSVNYSSTDTIALSSCDNYVWDGVNYTLSGVYTNIYSGFNGCDSIVVLDLFINNSSFDTISVISCDSFYWDNVTYNLSGIYTNLYLDQYGCDSTVTLDLFLNYSSFDTLTLSSCDTYSWDGITFDTSGFYTNIYSDANGCDSIVSIDLTILYSSSSSFIVSNCDSYDWDGITYSTTGLYTNIYNAVNSCDSIVILDLTIISSPNIIQNDSSICYGDSITLSVDLSSQMNSSSNICLLGELSTNLQNDLIAFYPLCGNSNDISLNSNTGIVNGAVLTENRFGDSLSAYSFNGNTDYIELSNSTSLSSLDSNLSLSFWIYPNNNNDGTIIDRDICGNNADWHVSWRANGSSARILLRVDNQYLYSGNYSPNQWLHIAAIKNNTNFELYINNQFQGSISAPINFINTSLPIFIGDQVCNSSTEPNFNGKIDDVGIWSRALNTNEVSQLYSSSFPNYVWSTGDTLSSITVVPNINTTYWVEKTENGTSCYDTIDITVLDTSSSYNQHTHCGDYFWNGVIYSNTGIYTYTTTNYIGCDSTAYLDLEINNTFSVTDSVGICPGDSVIVGPSIYSNIGTYIDSFQTVFGCDSVITTEIYNLPFGCTDPTAFNYDTLAICDDNSCIMPVYGCLDSTALNYYSGANFDDGSCIYVGCTDSTASNYNPNASIDDGSCVYAFCANPLPYGFYTTDITDSKARINWNNMNDSSCMVLKYFVRYREVGTNSWITKSAGVGSGLCNVGLNTQTKVLQSLNPSTTYEYKMKAFYCGGTESSYSAPVQFTTKDLCPDITNFTTQTFYVNPNKVRFSWDTTGLYVFARIVYRVDSIGSSWQTAGGYGIYYPNQSINKYGLQAGQFYRAQARTFCDSNITSYRSWWTPPIFWQQPGSSRINGGTTISNLDIYPNPSRDIFNISFVSEELQNLKLSILNVLGEKVYVEEKEEYIGEYTKQINLNNYQKGIYFLEIEIDSGIINKKLILQ